MCQDLSQKDKPAALGTLHAVHACPPVDSTTQHLPQLPSPIRASRHVLLGLKQQTSNCQDIVVMQAGYFIYLHSVCMRYMLFQFQSMVAFLRMKHVSFISRPESRCEKPNLGDVNLGIGLDTHLPNVP